MVALQFYDVVLWVHIGAVVVAFGGVFTYPVWFSMVRGWNPDQRGAFHAAQSRIGQFVISPGLVVIIAAGAYLASDRHYWSESWVTVPLIIAILLGALGGVYFAPRERRLGELRQGPEYDGLFVQVRNVSYAAMLLVLIAAFFMVVKP